MNVKDSVPKLLRSSVVYKFNCAGCNSVYVCGSNGDMHTRVSQLLYTTVPKNAPISLNVLGVSINVGYFGVIIVSQSYIQHAPIINLRLKRLCTFYGRNLF